MGARLAEPWQTAELVGTAVGLGLLPVLVRWLPDIGFGLPATIAGSLGLAVLAGWAGAFAAGLLQGLGREVRGLAARHRRAVRIGTAPAGVWALLLGAAGAVALGWSGGPVGAAGAAVFTALCAAGVAALSVLLLLERVLGGARRGVAGPAAVMLGLYLSAALFLLFTHRWHGALLVAGALAAVYLTASSLAGSGEARASGPFLGMCLLLGAFLLGVTHGAHGAVARLAPPAFLAAVLGTVTVLSVRRFAYWHGRLARYATAAAVVPLAYVMFLWFDGQLLGGPWEAPVFVPLLWLAVRLWRRMADDSRTPVAAAADIVFAVLLGAVLVLFLVWLANVLDLPVAEVEALRGAAADLGDLIDLPWWTWAAADVLLASAFLAAALGAGRMGRAAGALERARLPGALGGLRRTLAVLKTVLLSLVFVGLAGPPAVGPVLGHRIRAHYTADRQEELTARGRSALYQAITLRFTGSSQALPVLTRVIAEVYDRTAPHSASGDGSDPAQPTRAARDLAHRMGVLQARALFPFSGMPPDGGWQWGPMPPANAAAGAEAAARGSGMDAPIAGSADLAARLTREEDQEAAAGAQQEQAERAAEHAAAVVTGALGNLAFGHGVVIGLVREYLDGLAESGIGDLFLTRVVPALSRPAAEPAPSADRLVEPDATALRRAADGEVRDALRSAGVMPGTDLEQARLDGESPAAAAVDLAARSRDIRHGAASCAGCIRFDDVREGGRGGEHRGFHER